MDLYLKSLRDARRMSIPDVPVVVDYGSKEGHALHDVRLFPAIIRSNETVRPEMVLEEGHSTCFFHPKVTSTAICEVSGRLICDLCATEFEGKTVSFESLKTLVGKDGSSADYKSQVRWDTIALALAVAPIILSFLTIVTAPLALGICIFKWRQGPYGIPPKMRWRFIAAGFLSLIQIAFWVLLFTGVLAKNL